MKQEAIAAAKATGMLPHEWLLLVVRGEPVEQTRWEVTRNRAGKELKRELITEMVYPSLDARIDAAKAVAPYFAPKLATQTMKFGGLSGQGGKGEPRKITIGIEDASA